MDSPAEPSPLPPPRSESLAGNRLTFLESVAQTVGSMAPSGGIAMLIPMVFINSGNGTWLLYIPVVVGYMLLAANVNAFASRTASAGSFTAYAEMGLGPWMGILTGWTYFTTLVFAVASSAPSAAFYAAQVARSLGLELPGPVVIACVAPVALGAWWAARRDIRLSTDLMLGAECISLSAMVVVTLLFFIRTGRWFDADQFRLSGVTPNGLRLGMVLAFMSLTGFESVTTLSEEAKHPLKAVPRAIVTCIVPIGLLYLFMAYAIVAAFKGSGLDLGQSLMPFDHMARAAGWPRLTIVVGIGVTLCFFACLLGCMNAASRILYSLARQGRFWPVFGTVHPRNRTPARAISLVAALCAGIPLSVMACGVRIEDCMGYINELTGLGFISTYLLTCASAPFFLRRRGVLRLRHAVVAAAGFGIFGFALAGSVYPAPPPPWNFLPYVFAGTVATGVALTWMLSPGPPALNSDQPA
jgi:amino acid transporter